MIALDASELHITNTEMEVNQIMKGLKTWAEKSASEVATKIKSN